MSQLFYCICVHICNMLCYNYRLMALINLIKLRIIGGLILGKENPKARAAKILSWWTLFISTDI